MTSTRCFWAIAAAVGIGLTPARAWTWDEEGHVIVTRCAIRSLPPTMPEWVRSPEVASRLEYLCAEPDRWRGIRDVALDHCNEPEHFIDAESLDPYGLTLTTLPRFRREFTDLLATRRALHPDAFAPYDRTKDPKYTRRVPGLLPYAIAEYEARLTSSWQTLKTYEKYRDRVTNDMIRNARENVIYQMGIMSHFVGDGSQPLHLTVHYNGWVGGNPNGYTTDRHFHQRIDGGLLNRFGLTRDHLPSGGKSPRAIKATDCFASICQYLNETHDQVEPLYRMEKSGELEGPKGKAFLENRLTTGGAMLAGLWVAAYEAQAEDSFLETKLRNRPRTNSATSRPSAP